MSTTTTVEPAVTPLTEAATSAKVRKPRNAKATQPPKTKQAQLIVLMRRRQGATIAELVEATGWQAHSVRGAISGTLKKKLGMAIVTETVAGRGRIYRLPTEATGDGA